MKVLIITFLVILTDQVSKLLVKGFTIPVLNVTHEGMQYGERISIIGDFFRLTFIENPGMAFGIDPGSDFKLWISVFSLAASLGLLVYLYIVRNETPTLRIALAFILGGAIGNLIDRMFYGIIFDYAPLFYGRVVDFLDFDFFNFSIFGRSYDRWPIFNIADSAVTIGVLILIIFYNKHSKNSEDIVDETSVEETAGSENFYPDTASQEDLNEEEKIDKDEPDKGKEASL